MKKEQSKKSVIAALTDTEREQVIAMLTKFIIQQREDKERLDKLQKL